MKRWLACLTSAVICSIAFCSSSAAEQATPAAMQFEKRLYDQIGSVWYRYMQANSEKIPMGTAQIAMTISANGKITKLKVQSNTSNRLFATICVKAVREAKLPPFPPELLTYGKFENTISFKVFPN
jgi:outer membrane biosynthesis protein TonB